MDEERFYTIPEVAAKLKVTRAAVYKWMKAGKLAFVVVGSERRVVGSALTTFIKAGGAKRDVDSDDTMSGNIRTPGLVASATS